MLICGCGTVTTTVACSDGWPFCVPTFAPICTLTDGRSTLTPGCGVAGWVCPSDAGWLVVVKAVMPVVADLAPPAKRALRLPNPTAPTTTSAASTAKYTRQPLKQLFSNALFISQLLNLCTATPK